PLTAACPACLRLNKTAGKFEIIKDRAAVVRKVYALTLKGMGPWTIAKNLNEQAVPSFTGKTHWQRSYILKLLTNSATIGTYTPHTTEHVDGKERRVPLEPVPHYYPAAITEDTWTRVQAPRSA